MKFTIIYILALPIIAFGKKDDFRGLAGRDRPRKAQGEVVAEFSQSKDAKFEFTELEDELVLTVSVKTKDSSSIDEIIKEEDNPIKVFKKLQPGKEVPKKLKKAKQKIDKLKKEEEENPTEYPEVPDKDKDQPDMAKGSNRQLSYSCPDSDSSYGSRCWWLFNYCEGGSINKDECACYYHITNNYGYWAYDDNMYTYVHPVDGSLGVSALKWVCNGACGWQHQISYWCPKGWRCYVKSWGAAMWRKGETYGARGDIYDFSFYTNGGTPGVWVRRNSVCSSRIYHTNWLTLFPICILSILTVVCWNLPEH